MRKYMQGAAFAALTMAFAATANATEQSSGAPAAAATAGAEADVPMFEMVIVSALKKDTDLQKTPIAITVVGAENMADRHIQSLLDLGDGAVPGLNITTFEARQSALTIGIRGIVPLDANQPAREQGVGVYIDGIYLGRQHGLNAALLDVERIEVLKGPQGTLFGRNTEGGGISIVTKAPSDQFDFRATAGIANFAGYNADAHLNLPISKQLIVKLDGALQRQGAFVKNPLEGEKGWGYIARHGLRAHAQWKPTDKLTADYVFDVGRDDTTPMYSQLLNFNPLGLTVGPATGTLPAGQIRPLPSIVQVEGDKRMKVADIGVPQQVSVDKTNGHALRFGYSVNDAMELRSISAWREVTTTQWDNSGGAHRPPVYAPNGNFARYSLANLDQHQFSQEFQAVGNLERLDYVAGVYFFREKAQDDAATPSTNRWNATGTGYTINDPGPTQNGARFLDRASVAYGESWAGFGQVRYTPAMLNDRLHVTLGGRYTKDSKHGLLFVVNNAATNFTFKEKNNRFNPLAIVAYDVSDDAMVYAKYATGYRAGGASSRSLTYRSFGPEDVKSYELGAKMQIARRVRLNVTAYEMRRTDSQVDFSLVSVQPNGSTRNTLETINAPGTTKIRGLELEGGVRLTSDLTASTAYAYTDTKIPATANPFSGVVQPVFIVFTPKHAWSTALDYETEVRDMTFRAHVDANYTGATQTFDQTPVKNDKAFIVNARLSLSDIDAGAGKVGVALWARNLLNEAHVYRRDPANRSTLGDYGNFNAPRTYGVELTTRF